MDGVRGFVGGVVAAVLITVVAFAWSASAQQVGSDLGFTPVSPCRLIDTRETSPLRGGDTRTIFAAGGDCGVPFDAAAVSLNVTAVGATADTHVTIWGSGRRPTASSLNPAPGQPATPNAVITPLADGVFEVFNFQGSVNLIIDVNGYFAGVVVPPAGGTGFTAKITGYAPSFESTWVSGTVTSGRSDRADVRVDLKCQDGTVQTDIVFDVPPGQTRGWEVLCDGEFTSGARVTTVLI